MSVCVCVVSLKVILLEGLKLRLLLLDGQTQDPNDGDGFTWKTIRIAISTHPYLKEGGRFFQVGTVVTLKTLASLEFLCN